MKRLSFYFFARVGIPDDKMQYCRCCVFFTNNEIKALKLINLQHFL